MILPEDLGLEERNERPGSAGTSDPLAGSGVHQQAVRLEDVELAHIRRVLEAHAGNKAAAARALGINRRTLDRKLRT